MLPRNIPEGTWQDLAGDSFHHNNRVPPNSKQFHQVPLLKQNFIKSSWPYSQEDQITYFLVWTPKRLTTYDGPPFSSKSFEQFLEDHHTGHITSSPHYPKSNGFTECQIKTIKTALPTFQMAGQSIKDLLNIRSQPTDPHLQSPGDNLHNRTEEYPGRPSQPVDMEHICNYLITRKSTLKQNPHKTEY